jgi:hypothetical protein
VESVIEPLSARDATEAWLTQTFDATKELLGSEKNHVEIVVSSTGGKVATATDMLNLYSDKLDMLDEEGKLEGFTNAAEGKLNVEEKRRAIPSLLSFRCGARPCKSQGSEADDPYMCSFTWGFVNHNLTSHCNTCRGGGSKQTSLCRHFQSLVPAAIGHHQQAKKTAGGKSVAPIAAGAKGGSLPRNSLFLTSSRCLCVRAEL